MKLTLGQAAKHAGRAKGTLSKALTSGQISASKDEKGRWQIDPSELNRWMEANPFRNGSEMVLETPNEDGETPNEKSGLSVEVKMLREQIARIDSDREREREQLSERIDELREQIARQSADYRQSLAVLTDQRERAPEKPHKGFLARLWGRS